MPKSQLDSILANYTRSGSLLFRKLVCAFFDDKTLANSLPNGKRKRGLNDNRKGLDQNIVGAIKGIVFRLSLLLECCSIINYTVSHFETWKHVLLTFLWFLLCYFKLVSGCSQDLYVVKLFLDHNTSDSGWGNAWFQCLPPKKKYPQVEI